MNILQIAIIAFVVMELSNVVIMYFKPDFRYGNSMNSFKQWSRSKEDSAQHLFAKYMVRWVANCKLIFLSLLIVIVAIGDEQMLVYGVMATILSIGIYFFTLFPVIVKLDQMGEIQPKGYSKTLTVMIVIFMVMFTVALVVYFVTGGTVL